MKGYSTMTSTASITGIAQRPATTRQLAEFHASLQAQRQLRLAQLDNLTARGPDGPARPPHDPVDEVSNAMRAGATLALDEIGAALRRIETGRYGLCQACDRVIPIERLEMRPVAALCVQCRRARDVWIG
jgi:DnaK suppressor protein